jgi:hypothetical protein
MYNVQKLIFGGEVFAHLIFGSTMRVCGVECSNVQMFQEFGESEHKKRKTGMWGEREVNLDFSLFFFVHLNI